MNFALQTKEYFKTKRTYFFAIIFAGLILSLFFIPAFENVAFAEGEVVVEGGTTPPSTEGVPPTVETKGLGGLIASAMNTVLLAVPNLIAGGLLKLSAFILSLSAWTLDFSLEYTLSSNNLQSEAIEAAWGAVRDITNIIFVFILLYISIMTILKGGGFETRKLLTSLVVIALLVNFSLFFTKIVIDASNILAIGFYNQIEASGGLSTSLMNGLRIQTLFNPEGLGGFLNGGQQFMAYVLGIIVTLIAAFSFGVAAIMFLIRSVGLMFLMVISPLAFVAYILPNTRNQLETWWSYLLRYSFYAPAYILFISFTILIIGDSERGLLSRIGEHESFAGIIGAWFNGDSGEDSFEIIFLYAMVIVLIYGSYILAKNFGIKGADAVLSGATTVRKWGQGAIGGVGGAVARPLLFQQRAANAARAEAVLEADSGWKGGVARGLRKIPGVATALGQVGAAGRKDIETEKEKLKGLSTAAVQGRGTALFSTSAQRGAAVQELTSRDNLKTERGVTEEFIDDTVKEMKKIGATKEAKGAEKLQWQYKDLNKLVRDAVGEEVGTGVKRVTSIIKKIPKDVIGDLDEKMFKYDTSKPKDEQPLFEALISGLNKGHMEKLSDEKPEAVDNLIEGLGEIFGRETKKVIDGLKTSGERGLARWANSPAGRDEFKLAGFTPLNNDQKKASSPEKNTTTDRLVDEGLSS